MRTIHRFPKHIRWRANDKLPGQTLKRKKWILALIVLMCASFDVLLLFITRMAIPPLAEDAPYLPKEHAQEYTHLTTLIKYSHRRYEEVVKVVVFSPDGQTLAAAAGKELHLWDVSTGKAMPAFKEHQDWIHAVAFSSDGKTVASVSSKGSLRRHYLSLPIILLHPLEPRHLAPHTIRLLDAKTGTTRSIFSLNTLPITTLEFSSDGTKLLIVTEQGFTGIYDTTTGHREKFSRSLFVHDAIRNTYQFSALAFSSDDKIFATGGGRDSDDRGLYDIADAEIHLWKADTGHLLHTFNSPGGWVHLLTFSPDGKMLASTGKHSRRNTIFIWDVENRRLLTTINVADVGEKGVLTLKFAPDSITLASGHANGTVQIWDITGRTNR